MAFEIKTPPEFTVEIEQWNRETLADGIEMSKVIEKLLNNTIYNKHQRECQNHTTLVFLAASGWIGETAPYAILVLFGKVFQKYKTNQGN